MVGVKEDDVGEERMEMQDISICIQNFEIRRIQKITSIQGAALVTLWLPTTHQRSCMHQLHPEHFKCLYVLNFVNV